MKITPVYLTDDSGTTYNFTDYLSSVNGRGRPRSAYQPSRRARPATARRATRAAAGCSPHDGGIGYIDAAFAVNNHLRFAAVRNGAGVFIFPSLAHPGRGACVRGAGEQRDAHRGPAEDGEKLAYPISTYTYVILHKTTPHAAELRKMIFWALTVGQTPQYAAKLTFAPLSTVKSVLVASEKTLKQIHT